METVCFEAATHLGRAASSPIINQSNERNASMSMPMAAWRRYPSARRTLTFISQLTVRWG
jgi:N-methylhydantoinase B